MNKTSIEWTDYTWNPVTGCFHSCRNTYCYNTKKSTSPLNRFGAQYYNDNGDKVSEKDWKEREDGQNHIAKKGEIYPYGYDPTFYPHRLIQPTKIKEPSKIFVVDTGDLFGQWIPSEWINQVIEINNKCPQHIFQYLTKNPKRLMEYEFQDNAWAGTSVNSDEDIERADILKTVKAPIRYLSIEPLLGPVTFSLDGIQWIILGAQTGKKNQIVKPEKLWIDNVVQQAKDFNIPIFMKDNIQSHVPKGKYVQQFPSPMVAPIPLFHNSDKSIDVEEVVNQRIEVKESIMEKNMIIKNEGIREVNIIIKNGEINIKLEYESEGKPAIKKEKSTESGVMPIKNISKITKEQAYELLGQGLSPQEVSKRLGISRGTANAYKAWITMRKKKAGME